MWSIVGSCTTTTSGVSTGSCERIGPTETRQNAATGAPVRSEPKLGIACATRPLSKCRGRQQLGRGHDTLTTAAVEPDLGGLGDARAHVVTPRACRRSRRGAGLRPRRWAARSGSGSGPHG